MKLLFYESDCQSENEISVLMKWSKSMIYYIITKTILEWKRDSAVGKRISKNMTLQKLKAYQWKYFFLFIFKKE